MVLGNKPEATMRDQITETALAAASAGNKTTIAGGSLASLGWIASSEFAALCGVVIALIGLLVNVHYRRKADAREERMHQLQMLHEQANIAHAKSELQNSLRAAARKPNLPRTDTGD